MAVEQKNGGLKGGVAADVLNFEKMYKMNIAFWNCIVVMFSAINSL
jgi:hypothetical protein